jgi:hypothetical protein
MPLGNRTFNSFREIGRREELCQVFLDEPRAKMHIQLNQWSIADAAEAVNLAGLDYQNVTRTSLELLSIHIPESATLLDKLYLVVGVTMWARASPGTSVEQEC